MKLINKKTIEKQLPPGVDSNTEIKAIAFGLLAAVVYSLSFIYKYIDARNKLFVYRYGTVKTIMEGAVMPRFTELLNDTMDGFLMFFGVMLVMIGMHYMTYYKDSKSIYLMKRLPDKWEMYRRCVVVPLVAIFIQIITGAACLLLYYGIYLFFTPAQCLI